MKLGAQLYTLREYTQNEKDLDYSLGRVSEMGFIVSFETAGYR